MSGEPLAFYRVLFALLARHEQPAGPAALAEAAGVAVEDAVTTLRLLEEQGLLDRRSADPLPSDEILDRWVQGYAGVLRPRLMLGRYRVPDADPFAIERRIEAALGDEAGWAFGGSAAAFRVTGTFRGETTVLHLAGPRPDLAARLGGSPDAQGPLIVLEAPAPIAFDGVQPHLVHPLLVYTELQVAG